MISWLLFVFLFLYPFLIAFKGKKQKGKIFANKAVFYSKNIAFPIIILTAIYLVRPHMLANLNFNKIGRGILVPDDIISAILPIFFIPFILSMLPWNNFYSRNSLNDKELFGYPVSLLPDNMHQYLLFGLYVVVGVLFEEFICRQLMFYSFNYILGLTGDFLLIFTSFLFAIGHLYQRWKGMLSAFIGALILGKIFQMKGNIMYPIVLHLFFNLTILVFAFKRIKQKEKLKDLCSLFFLGIIF